MTLAGFCNHPDEYPEQPTRRVVARVLSLGKNGASVPDASAYVWMDEDGRLHIRTVDGR